MTQIDLFQKQIGEEQFSQQAIHVNPSALQEVKKVSKTTGTSGRSFLELLHKKDPLYAFSKMLVGIFRLDLMKFSMIWKVKATQQGRLYCQLKRVVHRTDEIDSGSSQKIWPTPKTSDANTAHMKPNKKGIPHDVAKGNLRGQVQMFPTPTANEDAAGRPEGKMQKMLGNHPEVRNKGDGTLNADWVEVYLMGYPNGWTSL